MTKKELTKVIAKTIDTMNLTETDLKKGREFALGFIVGNIYKQQDIIKYLKKPTVIKHNKIDVEVSLFIKFKKQFVKIIATKSDDNG